MSRLTVLALATCVCGNTQFSGLATPGDGSLVYFATALRQKNTTQPLYGKLFTVDSTGLKLFLSRAAQIPVPPPPGTFPVPLTNAYNLQSAGISSDGKVFATMGIEYCDGPGEFCTRQEPYITTISAPGSRLSIRFPHTGRYSQRQSRVVLRAGRSRRRWPQHLWQCAGGGSAITASHRFSIRRCARPAAGAREEL